MLVKQTVARARRRPRVAWPRGALLGVAEECASENAKNVKKDNPRVRTGYAKQRGGAIKRTFLNGCGWMRMRGRVVWVMSRGRKG